MMATAFGIAKMRNFLDLFDVTADEIGTLFQDAERLKADLARGQHPQALAGKVVALLFEKPSLRTRVSFQAAVAQLGGTSLFLPGNEVGLGTRESVPDFARTISEYVDAVVLRTFGHDVIETMARYATKPIINGLSDYYHPCQALADLFTVYELFGKVQGKTLVFVGDGNNVARSVAVCCGKLGARFILAAPPGYGFDEPFLQRYRQQVPKGELVLNGEPAHAVGDADVIYTDVWTSMGQEAERDRRLKEFAPFQVNGKLLALAPKHAKVMHCLPAHRGEEVTADVIDGERSVVFQQAGNRMHAQKALLQWLIR
jgi:ornithine carbamoyltransferase